jgi:uncharacterized caspase-like protein
MYRKLWIGKQVSLCLALAATLWPAGAARAQEGRPTAHVLSVGINRYRALNVPDLHGCANDARFAAEQLRNQDGKLFGNVVSRTLVDGAATKDRIEGELDRMTRVGGPGDWYVLFLSGHGSRHGGHWSFLPTDFSTSRRDATSVSDARILAWADRLIRQDKKVVIIVDACFSGELRHSARELLNRVPRAGEGGLILMMSSMPSQTSADLGGYSAFARAVGEALSGKADFNGDGRVTLREVRRYVYHRTYDLLRQRPGLRDRHQDGEVDASLSIPGNVVLALTGPRLFAAR